MVLHRPKLAHLIERMSYVGPKQIKKQIIYKMDIFINLIVKPHAHPTIEDYLQLLGCCHAKLVVLNEIHKFIQDTLCVSIPMWPQELWDLKETLVAQQKTLEEGVKTLCRQLEVK